MMGKYSNNRNIEIISVDSNETSGHSNNFKMHRMPYLADPSIVPRVQKYLEAHGDKVYVDINVMADDLQRQYREYAKRKRNAFRSSVKKAYSVVMQTYGIAGVNQSSSDDGSDGSGPEEEHFPENPLNTQYIDIYSRSYTKPTIDNELIDISSDDDNEKKTTNGASTSTNATINDKEDIKINDKINSKYAGSDRGKKRKLESNATTTSTKKRKPISQLQESNVTFKDVGGLDNVLQEVCKLLLHIKHPEIYRQIGITPPRGFLLHGPPGSGKTLLANAIAGELAVPLLKVAAPELVAGVSGESEERIRELFERSIVSAPCVLFIDEIDAITQNRQNAQKEMERRIVAQLLISLDDLGKNASGDQVLVIGATNRPDSLDPALRRAGRFDREVCLGIPDAASRVQILKVLTKPLKLSEDFNLEELGKHTPGYVGADLMSLTREAAMAAVNRVFNEIKNKKLLPLLPLPKVQVPTNTVNVEEACTIVDDKSQEALNKSDSEAIIDPGKEEVPPIIKDACTSTIVIIDDDVKKNELETVPTTINEPIEEIPDVPKTPLEQLIAWLHNDAPLNSSELNNLQVTMGDFASALKCVQPSAKREGFATVPDVTWDDIGSLRDIREELQLTILAPVRHAKEFEALGLTVPAGVLLCGPPGCGKTLLAKAIANEAGVNFISVKGPELLNMYVGESEKAVRVCFERARNSAPCVIFFDELDALCPKRSDSGEGGATMRVVNQMLTEMDGVESRNGVFLLAASNRPDIIDPAVLRPGRLDKILYVGLPTSTDRIDILRAITKNGTKPPMDADVDLEIIGKSEQCDGYTGADLAALVREAGIQALKDYMILNDPQCVLNVKTEHFNKAVNKIRPSISEKDQKHYEKLKKMYSKIVVQDNEVEEMEYS